jgi:hypothetical protein
MEWIQKANSWGGAIGNYMICSLCFPEKTIDMNDSNRAGYFFGSLWRW